MQVLSQTAVRDIVDGARARAVLARLIAFDAYMRLQVLKRYLADADRRADRIAVEAASRRRPS
jgi:hypothetical protein